MEYRNFGNSGLRVPVLSYGTGTFGGKDGFKVWGNTDVAEATRLIDVCLEAGLNFFDTANIYSFGVSEEILGKALEGRRHKTLISTKSTLPMGEGVQDYGSSRAHIMDQVEGSLRRLQTDYIDIYHMHQMDSHTPIEETLRTLDDLVKSGKVRYLAASNFSAWHLMKSMAISDREHLNRYVGHQLYYSLVGRDIEHEIIPAGLDQGVGTMVWSPLAGGALTGKIRRNQPAPKDSRLGQSTFVQYNDEVLYKVVDELEKIANERGKTISQVALNWLLRKPTVSNIIVGARNEKQLQENLGAVGWALNSKEVEALDQASKVLLPYPTWHHRWAPKLVKELPSVSQ